jgi:hypothetical protein
VQADFRLKVYQDAQRCDSKIETTDANNRKRGRRVPLRQSTALRVQPLV